MSTHCRDCFRPVPSVAVSSGSGLVADRGELRRLGWDLDANDQWVCPSCIASDARSHV